ncbi:3-hydroxyisobutyryl-CoA hydrolase mitochondrial [Spathaspora sp. JA1]|nr:3-hydroxyisobutyryl-CoA hydrolase mitochondrial [Spathaspora sp. JA1]
MSKPTISTTPITTTSPDDVVLFSQDSGAKFITLNREKKLNSLNTEMIELMIPKLWEYANSQGNSVIILNSKSPRALCAGGDVAACANGILQGDAHYGADFFYKEYNLNYMISTCPKPFVSIMDGITFGGGVGLSVHAPFRIATERTQVAMPEMDIGFFPDVGATFFLPRMDDKLGYYVALTGAVLKGVDAYHSGFATHYVKSENIPHLTKALSKNYSAEIDQSKFFAEINHIIDQFSEREYPQDYKFVLTEDNLRIINQAFSQQSITDVFNYLQKEGSKFSLDTLDKLSKKPMTSLSIALELLNRGAKNSIKDQFELEMVAATNIVSIDAKHNDFANGVAHKLIKKIKDPFFPEWNPASFVTKEFLRGIVTKSGNVEKYLPETLVKPWFGVDFKEYPHHFGLPSNSQVESYIKGSDGSDRSYLPTPNEVVKHFTNKNKKKSGVGEKVTQILNLHGETAKYDNKYVNWK